jgi:membrane protease YdiL (CAAX protease family)
VTSQANFIKRQPVLWYYIFVFAISWGGILLALGPGGFLGITATPETQLMVGGPISLLGPSISGILMTAILYGRAGLRQLLGRLGKWRVGAGWYAFALLLPPVLFTAAVLAIGRTPAIVTATDKMTMLIDGLISGLVVAFFEELGWTGFATPELRKRFGVVATGLIMGVLWGVWHFPLFAASAWASTSPPPALMLLVMLFSFLIPFRILMVWLYEHTRSLLLPMLMHLPIVAATVVLAPPAQSTAEIAAQNLTFTAALWTVAAVIYAAKRGKLEASAVPVAA